MFFNQNPFRNQITQKYNKIGNVHPSFDKIRHVHNTWLHFAWNFQNSLSPPPLSLLVGAVVGASPSSFPVRSRQIVLSLSPLQISLYLSPLFLIFSHLSLSLYIEDDSANRRLKLDFLLGILNFWCSCYLKFKKN